MCNIAAYAGEKQAAPILLEMIRRQQAFDGGLSAGIATIHEGKLHWRKIVGSVDDLMNNTDALSLPGTIGIAHTRPAGKAGTYEFAHPYLSMDEEMAVVSNGTTPIDKHAPLRTEMVRMLEKNGYIFRAVTEEYKPHFPQLSTGQYVGTAEVRVHLVDYYLKQGKSYTEALALCAEKLYADNVLLMINQNAPDSIFAVRTTRPMNVLLGKGETYMATTKFGFPEDVAGETMYLPLMHACIITKNGVTITGDRIQDDPVCEITPATYHRAYELIVSKLKNSKNDPVTLGLGGVLAENKDSLWSEPYDYNLRAQLAYDVLYQLHKEGRLKREIRTLDSPSGPCKRYVMWLDE